MMPVNWLKLRSVVRLGAATSMPRSKSTISGSAMSTWLTGSGGVITADTMKATRIITLRFFCSRSTLTIFQRIRQATTTGVWNAMPIASVSRKNVER